MTSVPLPLWFWVLLGIWLFEEFLSGGGVRRDED